MHIGLIDIRSIYIIAHNYLFSIVWFCFFEAGKMQKALNNCASQLESSESENNRLAAVNQILELKERKSNEELQEAQEELINVISIYLFLSLSLYIYTSS